jgi:hypothetical protein
VVPTGGTSTSSLTLTTNGTATLTNSVGLSNTYVKLIVDQMKVRNIPPYVDDDYVALAQPTTWRPLKNSLELIHQYTIPGLQLIFNGEIGRYEGTRFVEQTNVLDSAVGTALATWTAGFSGPAFFFGEDTVAEAIAIPEEIRGGFCPLAA